MVENKTPVVVTARLAGSVVIDPFYGLLLEGILTAVIRARLNSEHVRGSQFDGGTRVEDPVDYELPLARCGEPGGDLWHWAAGGSWIPASPAQLSERTQVRWLTSRLDVLRARHVAWSVPKSALGSRGRFRPVRRPVVNLVANEVCWRAVGDRDRLREWLADVPAVGARRGSGEGQVVVWDVREEESLHGVGEQELFTWLHSTPEGALSRPFPVGCAGKAGVGFRVAQAGVRPPVFHRSRQHFLAVPQPVGDV